MAEVGNNIFLLEMVGKELNTPMLSKKIEIVIQVGELGFLSRLLDDLHGQLVQRVENASSADEVDGETLMMGISVEVISNRIRSIYQQFEQAVEDEGIGFLAEASIADIEDYLGEQ